MRKGKPELKVAVPAASQKVGDNLAYQDDNQGCPFLSRSVGWGVSNLSSFALVQAGLGIPSLILITTGLQMST